MNTRPVRQYAPWRLSMSALAILLSLLVNPVLAAFVDNSDGTVTDSDTGLIWDACAWGRTWNAGACDAGTGETFDWAAALTAAVSANAAHHRGHADWRLPSKNELESLVDIGATASPAIAPLFPWSYAGTEFWSSTTYLPTPANAWRVDFLDGGTGALAKSERLRVRLVRSGQPATDFDGGTDIVSPNLSGVGVSGTGQTGTTLTATSDEAATGYWIVVPRDATAPTAAQVKSGVAYGGATVVAHGSGPMTAGTTADFAVSGLTAGTDYDLYLVAQDGSFYGNFSSVEKVAFATPVQTHVIAVQATAGGSAACDPNPVAHGDASTCTATPDAGNRFVQWSGDCSGTTCVLTNVTADRSVTAEFTPIGSHVIAASANPAGAGSATCAPNPVTDGGTASCSHTANPGYAFDQWSGDCSGATCVLTDVTATRQVTAHFIPVTATFGPIPTRKDGVTATLAVSGCAQVDAAAFIEAPPGGPAGMTFPYGLLDFTLSQCGATATVTVTYSEPLPEGAFYKETAGVYAVYPATVSGTSTLFTLTDNGAGDDNATAGTIHDPSGLAAATGDPRPIPALTPWALTLLSALLAVTGLHRRLTGWRASDPRP